jgi:membrane-associated phospholipid phosphatase
MPSLHCAYAFLVVLEGWAAFRGAWRAACAAFFALMCFSAVYLDHHWVLDAVAGITYCTLIVAIARVLMPVRFVSPASRLRVAEPRLVGTTSGP